MMDCKKALTECNGDIEEATVCPARRAWPPPTRRRPHAAEGAVGACPLRLRLGVVCEVNCETDFVARGDKFKELVADVAMQVAACPEIEYVSPTRLTPP